MSNEFMDALGKVSHLDAPRDRWEFRKDTTGDWRWTRTAPNGETVGAAHEGYRNLADCEANARRHGWNGVTGKISAAESESSA